MIFTVGNLITLGIVLLLFALYHRLTLDNRSLDKVKKMAERLRDELGEYADKRADDLKSYGIELDVQQQAAKVALDKLSAVQQSVAERAESIGAIEQRLSEYDAVLSRLMDMTKRVDENLARVQEESAFADSVNRKLDTAKKSMDAVERELPLLRESFAADAEKAVDSFKADVLAQMREGLDETASTLAAARDESLAALAKAEGARALVEESFAEAFAQARDKAETLEDEAFRKLKENSDIKAARLREAVEERFSAVGQDARTMAGEVREAIGIFKEEWDTEAKGLLADTRTEITAAGDALESRLAETERRLADAAASATEAKNDAEQALMRAAGELDVVSRAVEERGEKLRAGMEEESSRVLEAAQESFSSRMESYERESADRMARLEAANLELGSLDSTLRNSMEDTERSIEKEFASFGLAFEDQRKRFEENFGAQTASLRVSVEALGADLDALKKKAYDHVSGKLSEYEDELFSELSARRTEILSRLDVWTVELDSRVEAVTAEAVARRTAEEDAYLDQMRARMAENQERFAAQLEKLRANVQAIQDGIAAQAELSRSDMEAFKEKVGKDAAEARTGALARIGDEIAKLEIEATEALETGRKGLQAKIEELAMGLATEEEDLHAAIDAVRNDTGTLREQSAAALVEAEERFRSELDSFSVAAKTMVERARNEYETQRDAFERASLADRDRISAEIGGLSVQVTAKTSEASAAFERATTGLQTTLEALRVQSSSRIEAETARLSQILASLDKDQKMVLSQIKVFGEAETLRAGLEAGLDSLKKDIARVEARKAEITELESQMNRIRRLEDEVNQKLTRFMAEKRRIDVLEEDFGKLAGTSESVDKKIEEITGQADTLTEVQIKLQRLLELAKDADSKYERLDRKAQVAEAAADAADRNFQAVSALEKTTSRLGEETAALPARIADISKQVEQLASTKTKADEALRLAGDLDKALADTERRIAEVMRAREWIARAESRLEEIDRSAKEQLGLLSGLLTDDSGARDWSSVPATLQDTVKKLSRQGWSVDEIARTVRLSRGEVELILELDGKR